MPTMTVAPPPAAGRDDGSQGARRPRGASRCASQPLRAPRPCKHGSLRPRGTPAHRCAPHSLCATRAKFCAGQPRCLDELIFCFVLRDAAALLSSRSSADVSFAPRTAHLHACHPAPPHSEPCKPREHAHVARRAHARMRARATASRASPARDHLYPRVHVVLQVSTLPASIPNRPGPERAIWARSRPRAASRASEVRAEPKSSPPSASPAEHMPALRVPSAACRAETPVYGGIQ